MLDDTLHRAVHPLRAQWSGPGVMGHEQRHILFLIFIAKRNSEFPSQTLK